MLDKKNVLSLSLNHQKILNRALNAYDPGSVWKIVTALAGLESGKFPRDTILDTKPCIYPGSTSDLDSGPATMKRI